MRREISPDSWHDWEKLAGACYPQRYKFEKRVYTDEQVNLFLCLAYLRSRKKGDPDYLNGKRVTYRSLRNFYQANAWKVEEVFNKYCESDLPEPPKKEEPTNLVDLKVVKERCDEIMGFEITRKTWSNWKKHLGITPRSKVTEKPLAWMLVYIACFRRKRPSGKDSKLPSFNRIKFLAEQEFNPHQTLETVCSSTQLHQWEMWGCPGKDLHRYLAAHGLGCSTRTLYLWGERLGGKFSTRHHYSPSELEVWKKIAKEQYAS